MKLNPQKIKLARGRKGWKQYDLAREARISSETVSNWERGETEDADPILVVRAAAALGVEPEALLQDAAPSVPPAARPDNSSNSAIHESPNYQPSLGSNDMSPSSNGDAAESR